MFFEKVRVGLSVFAGAALACLAGPLALADEADTARLERQKAEYDEPVRKTIVELQMFRTRSEITDKDGTEIALTALNPVINSWLLLEIDRPERRNPETYHIENIDPVSQTIRLESEPAGHITITSAQGTYRCIPWRGANAQLDRARSSGLAYAPICGGRLYLRTEVRGNRTNLEATTEFLRDNVWLGESLVGFVKDNFFQDSEFEEAEEVKNGKSGTLLDGLVPFALEREAILRTRMGLTLEGADGNNLAVGTWYPVARMDGVYATTMQPGLISRDILQDKRSANWLDGVESAAQSYFVAFDMTKFTIGYEVGTEHPRVDWSPRPPNSVRNHKLPGPDGIGDVGPVANVGMVSPAVVSRVVATFTGGYKRSHAAFRSGELSWINGGTHYGIVVNGVVESKLQPHLSTIYVLDDGTIGMKTWTESDNAMLPHIRFARQNGVPLVIRDPDTLVSIPGPLVQQWGPGNWSGSAEANLRTLRGGACMRTAEGKQWLIYGYFSTATPSAMARTFQAMSCDYAMLLDMNAVEHTYMALYVPIGGALQTQHLVPSMSYADMRNRAGERVPRFIGFSDNRDFFYIMRREAAE